MKSLKFKGLLQEEGWVKPAYVQLNKSGEIINISKEELNGADVTENIAGYAIPGFQNGHSHAFQYAMAGLAENHKNVENKHNFWSWRDKMYQIALSINPDQLQDIATMLYTEMLRHGYTSVAEFHYLHLDPKGNCYNNKAALAERLILAARNAGINITLIPIFYQKGGFNQPPSENQRRFISKNRDSYLTLWEASKTVCEQHDHANIALGFHSLRAVDPKEILPTIQAVNDRIPIHIHVSEQLLEISQCQKALGLSPVAWLMAEVGLNNNFHLVHATHISEKEIAGITKSGAHVVLCPSTEGNLGDGLFPYAQFQQLGGKWAIGTDSHIGLNPFEELRILDYGQRLITHDRNTFHFPNKRKGGEVALHHTTYHGRMAMGKDTKNFFEKGKSFDALIIDASHPLIATTDEASLASTIVYASDPAFNLGTMVSGQWVIQRQIHERQEQFTENFCKALKEILIRS